MAKHQPSPGKGTEVLSMENELLSFEVSFLKGRLADLKDSLEDYKQRARKAEQRLEVTQANTISPEEKARLELAYRDLVLLINRISKSPVGRLLRQRPAFRELENRYLE